MSGTFFYCGICLAGCALLVDKIDERSLVVIYMWTDASLLAAFTFTMVVLLPFGGGGGGKGGGTSRVACGAPIRRSWLLGVAACRRDKAA